MIPFRDIQKELYEDKVNPENCTDNDLKSPEGVKLVDEPCLDNGDGEKIVKKHWNNDT